MVEEPTQTKTVLPPENVNDSFRPYYALLVDRALDELRKGRSDIELRVELQKITPSKAVLEAGFATEEFITEAIAYAKSIFAPKVSPEGVRIEPIIEKLGAPEPPKASDLFAMLKTLKERERLFRTAGFDSQRAALRSSLDEITQRLATLVVPVKQAGAFPFELSAAKASGLASATSAPQEGLVAGARYMVSWTEHFGGAFGDQPTKPQELKFISEVDRNGIASLQWETSLGAAVFFPKADLLSAEVTSVPIELVGKVSTTSSIPVQGMVTTTTNEPSTSLSATGPLATGEESLILPAGTEETRKAVDAKIAEGFVLTKVISNSDGTATFLFVRVSGAVSRSASVPEPQIIAVTAPVATSIIKPGARVLWKGKPGTVGAGVNKIGFGEFDYGEWKVYVDDLKGEVNALTSDLVLL